jgi:hypothetical protein
MYINYLSDRRKLGFNTIKELHFKQNNSLIPKQQVIITPQIVGIIFLMWLLDKSGPPIDFNFDNF